MPPKGNPRIPLSDPVFGGNELKYVTESIESTWISSSGSFVKRFENELATTVDAANAVACVNGTAALHLALIVNGIGSDDEVIVPTLTFIAPINTVRYVNAEPVFMDCDDYLNMDVAKLEDFLTKECDFRKGILVNRSTGRQVKAILPVHVFGHVCNMERIMQLAQTYDLVVIEDATEALGSKIIKGTLEGSYAGTIGNIGCFSFNGNKIITCGGGGMLVSADQRIAERVRYLSTQANNDGLYYQHDEVGYNYRLSALQAAVGLAQLEQLGRYLEIKARNFRRYQELIAPIPGLSLIPSPDYCQSNYWFYSLLVDESKYGLSRNGLLHRLINDNIQARPVWKLNHRQKPYRTSPSYRIEKALFFEQSVLNLPCSVDLAEDQIARVISLIKD